MDIRVDEAYREVTEKLGEPPATDAWEAALDGKLVDEYLHDEIDLEELVEGISDIADLDRRLKAVRQRRRQTANATRRPNHRQRALHAVFGIEAARSSDVIDFRDTYLSNGLLPDTDVGEWIRTRQSLEGSPDVWLTIRERELLDTPITDIDLRALQRTVHSIAWTEPGVAGTHRLPICSTEGLGRLRSIASRLSRRYGWPEARATTFVLTGISPRGGSASWMKQEGWPWRKARRSVTMEIGLDISPPTVAALYRRLRNEMLEGEPKPRTLSEHQASLAVFAARWRPDHKWREVRTAWNKENPDREYHEDARFTKECRDAFKRVTGEPINVLIES